MYYFQSKIISSHLEHLPSSDARHEDGPSSRSPSSAGEKRLKRRAVSVSSDGCSENENGWRHKARREDDTISVHATDDDVAEVLDEPPVHRTVNDKPSDTSGDELLKELVAALQDDDKKGPKFSNNLLTLQSCHGAIN